VTRPKDIRGKPGGSPDGAVAGGAGFIRSFIAIATALAFPAFVSASFAGEVLSPQPKIIRAFGSKKGDVILELRGKENTAREAWAFFPRSGKRRCLAVPETYIEGGAISEDGRCIALRYHVSSGGWTEAFVRAGKGEAFSRLFGSAYADRLISAGRVRGLSKKDIPSFEYRNTFHELHLRSSPNCFISDIGQGKIHVTYSVEKRRIVEWDRRVFAGRSFKRISLRELSGHRGFALVRGGAYSEPVLEMTFADETLVKFPSTASGAGTRKWSLRKTSEAGGTVEMNLEVDEAETSADEEIDRDEAIWRVELSGQGRDFAALAASLTKIREELTADAEKANWPEVTKFSVIGKAPANLVQARLFESIDRTLSHEMPLRLSNDQEHSDEHQAGLSSEAKLLSGRAKEAIEQGNYSEAARIHVSIAANGAKSVRALVASAAASFQRKEVEQAGNTLKKALALEPDHAEAHRLLGVVYYHQRKDDAAVDELRKAIDLQPDDAVAHNYLGVIACLRGWPKMAEEEIQRAITIDPNYADACLNLAVYHATQQPPDKQKARKNYQRALELGSKPNRTIEGAIE